MNTATLNQSRLSTLVSQYNAALRALRLANKLKRNDLKSRVFKGMNHIRAAIAAIPVALPKADIVGVVLDSAIVLTGAVASLTALAAPFVIGVG